MLGVAKMGRFFGCVGLIHNSHFVDAFQFVGRDFPQIDPRATAMLNESLGLKLQEGVPHRTAANAQLRCQNAMRKPRFRLHFAVNDHPTQRAIGLRSEVVDLLKWLYFFG